MNWLDKQVSFYKCAADNFGRPATYRSILMADFAISHEWFYKDHATRNWISGVSNDITTIISLRTGEFAKEQKVMMKNTMQCFTPASLLKTKKQGQIEEINRTGIMQIDFDYKDIKDYDIEELKLAVFNLPFIAFCGLSCSGLGFYALAAIAEPERLEEYAEHCFVVLDRYGVPADTTKGTNVNDLRFVSYDPNMLIRDNPETLKIKRFLTRKKKSQTSTTLSTETIIRGDKIVSNGLNKIRTASIGGRWQAVQQVAYTLGGLNDDRLLSEIKETITYNSEFAGEEDKYFECATVCFFAGKSNPLKPKA